MDAGATEETSPERCGGDASPWHLEQISKTAFVQPGAADAGQSVRFEFDTGPDGEVAGLRVLYDGRPFLAEFPHLQRLREIPRGTEGDCLQTI